MRCALIAAVLLTGCAKHYHVQGIVLHADPAKRTVLVSHRPIEGYMPAMAMTFNAGAHEDLSRLTPGTRVDFGLRVGKHSSEARHIRVRESRLEDVDVPVPANKLGIGALVPDFTLTDQSGRSVRLSDFRGRVTAVDFIYTRCPLPDVCPRLSANFAYLFKRVPGVQLLSITIDPQYDTPAVLSDYARRYGADGERWRFLTGEMDRIREVAGLFGLVYWPEEGSITHTVATAVVSPDGKLAALIEGSGFRPEQLRDLVQHAGESR